MNFVCITFSGFKVTISAKPMAYSFHEEWIRAITESEPGEWTDIYIQPICHSPSTKEKHSAMSKIYEFTPHGLATQTKSMFVLPLYPQHRYNYSQYTLMYRQNSESEFVPADFLTSHKPSWLFQRGKCYFFANHFCGIFVKERDHGTSDFTLMALLFVKSHGRNLDLLLTFGCFADGSSCSKEKLIKVNYFAPRNIKYN